MNTVSTTIFIEIIARLKKRNKGSVVVRVFYYLAIFISKFI